MFGFESGNRHRYRAFEHDDQLLKHYGAFEYKTIAKST